MKGESNQPLEPNEGDNETDRLIGALWDSVVRDQGDALLDLPEGRSFLLDLVADEFLGVYGQAREQGHSGAGLSIDMLRPRLWYLTPAGIERLVKALEALDIIQRTSEQRSGDEPAWRYNAAPDEPGEPGRTLRQRLPYDMDATAGDMEADT